eukprot:8291537-Lingulodinium_polyedra.AAC.1
MAGRGSPAAIPSSFAYAIPAIVRAIAELRPDLLVHALCENAGSMRPEFKAGMLDALGIEEGRAA